MEWLESIYTILPEFDFNIFITISCAALVIGLLRGMGMIARILPQRFLQVQRGIIVKGMQFLVVLVGLAGVMFFAGLGAATLFTAMIAAFLVGTTFGRSNVMMDGVDHIAVAIEEANHLQTIPSSESANLLPAAVEGEAVVMQETGNVEAALHAADSLEAATIAILEAPPQDVTNQEPIVDVHLAKPTAEQDSSPSALLPIWRNQSLVLSHRGISSLKKRPILGQRTIQALRVAKGK